MRAERRRRTAIKARQRLTLIRSFWKQFLYLAQDKMFRVRDHQTMRHYKHDDSERFERTLIYKEKRNARTD